MFTKIVIIEHKGVGLKKKPGCLKTLKNYRNYIRNCIKYSIDSKLNWRVKTKKTLYEVYFRFR